MFTGLVERVGQVESTAVEAQGRRLGLVWPELDVGFAPGESVAVNGCCLTVVNSQGDRFVVQAGPETLAKTNLGTLRSGDEVNLERALRVGDRLGGHFVQGHVDAAAEVVEVREEGEWRFLRFRLASEWTSLMVPKGSIAVDGVSLTLVTVDVDSFTVMLIPHTLEATNLGGRRVGDRVNVEMDMLAKHVRKLLGV